MEVLVLLLEALQPVLVVDFGGLGLHLDLAQLRLQRLVRFFQEAEVYLRLVDLALQDLKLHLLLRLVLRLVSELLDGGTQRRHYLGPVLALRLE